jgi:hypothetical protein
VSLGENTQFDTRAHEVAYGGANVASSGPLAQFR